MTTTSLYAATATKTTKTTKTSTASIAAEKITLDPAASKVTYVGKKVTGSHTGEVKISSGHLNFSEDTFTGGEVVMDMTSINNTDLTDKEYNKKFVDHMHSDDFFSTAKHKTATLVVKTAKLVKGTTYNITGDLTIKGQTHPVKFDADVTKSAVTANLAFDRTKYDVKYGSGKFFQGLGDKMINDDVQLSVNLQAMKK